MSSENQAEEFAPTSQSNGLWRIFLTFLLIGVQSFGGGSATFLLLHQACLKYGWMTEEEFLQSWSLCQLAPGINLVKLTILVGNKLRGWRGILVAASGMLAPSSLLTILMTAFYSLYQDLPALKAAMGGILPATIGLSLAMSANLVVPLYKAARVEGRLRLGLQGLLIAASGVALVLDWLPPVAIMLMAVGLTTLLMTYLPVAPSPTRKDEQP